MDGWWVVRQSVCVECRVLAWSWWRWRGGCADGASVGWVCCVGRGYEVFFSYGAGRVVVCMFMLVFV